MKDKKNNNKKKSETRLKNELNNKINSEYRNNTKSALTKMNYYLKISYGWFGISFDGLCSIFFFVVALCVCNKVQPHQHIFMNALFRCFSIRVLSSCFHLLFTCILFHYMLLPIFFLIF